MVYEKYIKKKGKIHGPYYYKSVRDPDTGKIKTVYLGTELPKSEKLDVTLQKEKPYTLLKEKIKDIKVTDFNSYKPKFKTHKLEILKSSSKFKTKISKFYTNNERKWEYDAIVFGSIFLFIIIGSFLILPLTIGLVTLTLEPQSFVQPIEKILDQDQTFDWDLQNTPESFYLENVKLTGQIKGHGDVKIYLKTFDNRRFLIVDDDFLTPSPGPKVTGFATLENETNTNVNTGEVISEIGTPGNIEEPNIEESTPEPEILPEDNLEPEPVQTSEPEEISIVNLTNNTIENQLPEEEPPSDPTLTDEPPEEEIEPELFLRELSFNNYCIETCELGEQFNLSTYQIVVEIIGDAIVTLDSITYELVDTTSIEEIALLPEEEQKVVITPKIRDSKGKGVKFSLKILDEQGNIVGQISKQNSESVLSGVGAQEVPQEPTIEISPGTYTIELLPEGSSIKKILFKGLLLESTFDLGLEDLFNETNFEDWLNVYAIDPTSLTFTEADVTIVPTGTTLLKCSDYDFTTRNCRSGTWETFANNLVPGIEYTFTINNRDPAFAEIVSGPLSTKDSYIRSFSSNQDIHLLYHHDDLNADQVRTQELL